MRRRPSSPGDNAASPRVAAADRLRDPVASKDDGAVHKELQKKELEQSWPTEDTQDKDKARPWTQEQNPWSCSILTLTTSFAAILLLGTILHSFLNLQQEPKGCQMSYMMPIFHEFSDFDTEHTRFASKYSLHLYREGGIDEDIRVKGIPVVFVPGNAGSYKQVRPIAAEAATYYHSVLREDPEALAAGKRPLDFFSVDFNEDITAFHGQTLLDQAEYLNEAIAFILALYHTPGRFQRDGDLPDPKSVIVLGHSMGGMVARTMLTMPNYQENTINTIITLSAPHARAPVSFDATMVSTYQHVNDYWRRSYLVPGVGTLQDVTLVSIAGGGLDTMIPSEYTSVTSLVPDTHGFTVFTSGIPKVWTSVDHLAIMWCDQFRKALTKSIFDVVDARERTQTVPRPNRIELFRQRLLTGMEMAVQQSTPARVMDTTLIFDRSTTISWHDKLDLRTVGAQDQTRIHVLTGEPDSSFRLLTNKQLGGDLVVLLCTANNNSYHSSRTIDLSGFSMSRGSLLCRDRSDDAVLLPASTHTSKNAFDDSQPFSYLEIANPSELLVVVEKPSEAPGWLIADSTNATAMLVDLGHRDLILSGLHVHLPASRSLMVELKIPGIHSTLFAYSLDIQRKPCLSDELFSPLLRQYIAEPYESKYFVNLHGGNINVHGLSPYMPPQLSGGSQSDGLSLQIWTDPTCNTTIDVSLKLDKLGSAGKIVMRYRTIVAVLPILVVLIVTRKQFKVYDATGLFISFSESMDQCIRTSIPFIFLALTFFAISLSKAVEDPWSHKMLTMIMGVSKTLPIDFTINDFMLGTQDPFLWFLVPLFGIISVGICITANYLIIILMSFMAACHDLLRGVLSGKEEQQSSAIRNISFQRIITTIVLLLLVTTLVPYQFAYVVLAMVQFGSCFRGLRAARAARSAATYNFYNCAHTILLLMLWTLPIEIPVLVVWLHNLSLHWMTPFSTHHNLTSILPLVLCVEVLSSGQMVPRISGRGRHITNTLTFLFALFAAVYGNTYAYRLHYLLNALTAWLLVVYLTSATSGTLGFFGRRCRALLGVIEESKAPTGGHAKKTP